MGRQKGRDNMTRPGKVGVITRGKVSDPCSALSDGQKLGKHPSFLMQPLLNARPTRVRHLRARSG